PPPQRRCLPERDEDPIGSTLVDAQALRAGEIVWRQREEHPAEHEREREENAPPVRSERSGHGSLSDAGERVGQGTGSVPGAGVFRRAPHGRACDRAFPPLSRLTQATARIVPSRRHAWCRQAAEDRPPALGSVAPAMRLTQHPGRGMGHVMRKEQYVKEEVPACPRYALLLTRYHLRSHPRQRQSHFPALGVAARDREGTPRA